jgi:predicted HTH transcriptional regulator
MSHERLAVTGAELDDIDLPAMEAYVRRRAPGLVEAGTFEEAAQRLGLLTKAVPRVAPTPVGLFVFGRAPQLIVPDWGVAALAVHGTTLADPITTRLDLEGDLASLVTQTLAFVREQTGGRGAALPDGTEEYPEGAVRETVVNALVHRDLRRTGRVAVRLFVDRMEVWSPGGPPEGLTDLEELLREGGVSQPRNPLLAATARALGIGEQVGRGLPTVGRNGGVGVRRVEIRTTPRDVLVVLPSRWQRPLANEALS